MKTLIALIIALSLIVGFWGGYKFESARTRQLEHYIELSNIKAENALADAKARAKVAELAAIELNKQIEENHELNNKKLAALNNELSLHNTISQRLQSELTKSNRAAQTASNYSEALAESAAEWARFSDKTAKFLSSEARRADELAIYADSAYQFINNKCGIQ